MGTGDAEDPPVAGGEGVPSSPVDWVVAAPQSRDVGGVGERLAFARVTEGLLGRRRWPELGRYAIERRLGKGAFGSVLLAHDPELDRDVAIKIVALPRSEEAAGRKRSAREARALAALTHDNVVQVYDFGLMPGEDEDDPGALYIVMELLRGDSVRAWFSRDTPPTQAAVLAVFDRIAVGLAAVHDAGLVHRDIKPDNVVLTEAGVPKLIDFGLVRERATVPASSELEATTPAGKIVRPVEDEASDVSMTAPQPTAVGAVLGTPQYMAPEQHEGLPATAKSDQFGLAAALFEGLALRMPFDGVDLEDLAQAKRDRMLPAPLRPIARPVLAVLRRALSPSPDDRYPSVEAFRSALRAAALRRRAAWAVVGVGALISVPLAAITMATPEAPRPACPRGPLFAAAESTPPAQPDGRDGLSQWADLSEALENYAHAWEATRDQICEHAPDPHAEIQARRIACLEQVAAHARTWLHAAKTKMADDGPRRIADLPSAARCSELADDLAGMGAAQRAEVAAAERRLAELEAHLRLDNSAEIVAQAEHALAAARVIDHPPLSAQALDVTGRLQLDLGRYADADRTLTEAVWTSLAADRPSRAALIVPRLLYAREHSAGPAEFDEAVTLAHRVLDEADAPPALRARVGTVIGFNQLGRSRFADADKTLSEVRALLEAAGATVSSDYGETLTGLSAVARNQGRLDDALALAQTAVDVLTRADGPEAVTTAFAHERVGAIHHARGEHSAAAQRYERSIGLIEAKYGRQHPDLAWPRLILAMLWVEDGRLEEAAEVADWALSVARASVGPDSEMIAVMLFNRSIIAEKQQQWDRALQWTRDSREISARIAGERGADVADADRRIGSLLIRRGDPEAALTPLENARAQFQRLDQPADVAQCDFLRAKALAALGRGDDARAQGREALTGLPEGATAERAEVEAFLATVAAQP